MSGGRPVGLSPSAPDGPLGGSARLPKRPVSASVAGAAARRAPDLAHSSNDDLSFQSAQQLSSEDYNGTSSDAYVSVKGTPFSSADSVTVSADVHRPAVLRRPPGSAVLDTESDSSSDRTERYDTPPSCCRTCDTGGSGTCEEAARSAREREREYPPHPPLRRVGRRSLALCTPLEFPSPAHARTTHSPLVERVPTAQASPSTDDNSFCSSHASNNNIKDFKIPGSTNMATSNNTIVFKKCDMPWKYHGDDVYQTRGDGTCVDQNSGICNSNRGKISDGKYFHPSVTNNLHAMESLPLLSTLGEVQDKTGYVQKYTYPITSVGKGESSV